MSNVDGASAGTSVVNNSPEAPADSAPVEDSDQPGGITGPGISEVQGDDSTVMLQVMLHKTPA